MLLAFADWMVYGVMNLSPQTHWGATVHFFVYDSVKILWLLFVLIFIIGILRTFLPQRKIKQWVGQKGWVGYFYASLFGAVTPFCSCSSIPIFFSLLKAGIPLGAAFSFLIASPLINEYLVILMLGLFGWKITVLYIVSGLSIGIISGAILGRMKLERYLVSDVMGEDPENAAESFPRFIDRCKFGLKEAVLVTRKIWAWVLIGVAIGAAIHNYVPQEVIHGIISKTGIFSVPIAVLLGVPMYGSCAAILPVAIVLFQKGVPLGTALAFMMSIAALSLPEAIMLRRAMRLPLIAMFFLVTALSMIFIGYMFNALESFLKF